MRFMSGVKMLVSALTDVGRARANNEDAFTIRDLASGRRIDESGPDQAIDVLERGVLLALSDGMGGAQAGEVASALVLESLHAALEQDTKHSIQDQLEQAVHRANESVLEAARRESRKGMAATVTALFVRGDEAYIAEVGDSRAYLLRKGRLRQITRDQSLVQLLIDQGLMSAEEARYSPNKNVILQAVGLATDVRVAIARLRMRRGDRFLLCSDGVSNAITDAELLDLLARHDPRAACEAMIALANDRGGHDNQTAIVADLSGDGLPLPDEWETVTETYEVIKAYEGTGQQAPESIRRSPSALRPSDAPPAEPSTPPADPPTPPASPATAPAAPAAAAPPAAAPPAAAATPSAPTPVVRASGATKYPPAPHARSTGMIAIGIVLALALVAAALLLAR